MSVQQDFDRIALVTEASEDGAAHNDHYHNYLLRHLPTDCENVLEIGCGTGAFSRRLAAHFSGEAHRDRNAESANEREFEHADAGSADEWEFEHANAGSANEREFEPADAGSAGILPAAGVEILALDFSPEMIRIARERSAQFPNIKFELADVLQRDLPDQSFDCIATIATLHHLPLEETLLKMKAALRPAGVLLVLDLFEPARISDSLLAGLSDSLLNLLAIPVSVGLRLIHRGRLLPRREERAAWSAHEVHDLYPTMREVHTLCARILPGAKIRKHLLWRYSIVWVKPSLT